MLARTVPFDTEFHAPAGEQPKGVCIAAEHAPGDMRTTWLWDGAPTAAPPLPADPDTLAVAFFASADTGCLRALNLPVPRHLICLHAAHRALTNGRVPDCLERQTALADVCRFWEIPFATSTEHKAAMRDLCIRGGPFSSEEQQAIMAYCAEDVVPLRRLFHRMIDKGLDVERALIHGRYVDACSVMELHGVPVDVDAHGALCDGWGRVREHTALLAGYTYEGIYVDGSFVESKFERYLSRRGIPWPRHRDTGRLKLDDDTVSDMARLDRQFEVLHDVRKTMAIRSLVKMGRDGVLRPTFRIGADGRNRAIIGPFKASTGRNQPRTSEFVLSSAAWLRGGLIRPPPRHALAYVDWRAAEIGVMAALSKDANMSRAYESGDAHMYFAQMVGHAPWDAVRFDPVTGEKTEWDAVRNKSKVIFLATSYCMGGKSLGQSLGIQTAYAEELLALHRGAFPSFWRWSNNVSATAHSAGLLRTIDGWPLHISMWSGNDRSVRNFPVQATCASVLRLAACMAVERGIMVLGPLHDAFLIEAPEEAIDDAVKAMREVMRRASEIVLDGFALDTDVTGPVRYPDRLGVTPMWRQVMRLLGREP